MLQRQDGLVLCHGMLRALRENENEKLRNSLTAATADEKRATAVVHMLVNRRPHRAPYTVSVAPLATTGASYVDPLVVVFVADPEDLSPADQDLMELFGWSPAETRLVAALMAGKSLPDVAAEFDLSVTKIGSQLRSISKKAGVTNHGDLLRVVYGSAVRGNALATDAHPAIQPRPSRGRDVAFDERRENQRANRGGNFDLAQDGRISSSQHYEKARRPQSNRRCCDRHPARLASSLSSTCWSRNG